jgi:ADP-heptose:LPS heptosyltransferase
MKRGKATNRLLDFYLGIPVLNLFASLRRRGKCPENPERVGLLFNPAMGDTLLASAAVQDIRSIFPASKLVLFAAKTNIAAAKLLPAIDAIEMLPISRPLEAVRVLRRCELDLMLDFTSWQRVTAFYTMMSGAKFTVGFERKQQFRHRGYDKTIPHQGDCHEVENLRRLTRSLGAKVHSDPQLLIPCGPTLDPVSDGKRLVVFHAWATGTLSFLREWPDDRWVDLANRLAAPGRSFLLTGSPADEPRCLALCEKLTRSGISAEVVIGRDGIAGVARLLQQAEMLISVNTGIMHLAAILGVPTVALNGPNSAHRWGPVGPRVANVRTSDGSGGFLDLGFEFRGRNVMVNISVAEVMRAVHQLQSVADNAEISIHG